MHRCCYVMLIYIRLFSQSERMICFTSLHDVEVLQKHFRNLQNRISTWEWNTSKCKGALLNLKNPPKKWHSLSAKVRYARIYPSIHIIVRGHFFGRRYCVMISCEAWPRQKKEHVECNVETCADMCLWRNLCFCFTIGFFGGLRFGVCFSNAFGMPFLFSERCRFQVRSLMLVMSNRTLHSCQYFGPSIGGEQLIINNHP